MVILVSVAANTFACGGTRATGERTGIANAPLVQCNPATDSNLKAYQLATDSVTNEPGHTVDTMSPQAVATMART
jgi:hypothetical protein